MGVGHDPEVNVGQPSDHSQCSPLRSRSLSLREHTDSLTMMPRRPIFLRPLTALSEEAEAVEVAEIVRLVEAAMDEMSAQEGGSPTTRPGAVTE